jgi:hypothetical protein
MEIEYEEQPHHEVNEERCFRRGSAQAIMQERYRYRD